jgi:putative peptidoglycan lipid II flippase
MSRRLTAGDNEGAMVSQRRAFELTLLMSVPFLAAFLVVPDAIMRALFVRGAFSQTDAAAAGATLAAYAIALIPFVLIRSAVATFYARKDTSTPVRAALIGVAVNVALKVALVGSMAQVGLALATAAGAWVNLLLVMFFAARAGYLVIDRELRVGAVKFACAGIVLAAVLWGASKWLDAMTVGWGRGREELILAALMALTAIVYGLAIWALFGRRWIVSLAR